MDLDEPYKTATQFRGNREHDNRESYEGGSEIGKDKDEYLSPENEDGDASSKTTVTAYTIVACSNCLYSPIVCYSPFVCDEMPQLPTTPLST